MVTSRVALTPLTIAFFKCEGIAEESGQTSVAVYTARVVDALEAFTCGTIAVTHRVGINVSVAVAGLARLALAAKTSFRITEETITAQLAARAGVTDGAFQTDNCFVG